MVTFVFVCGECDFSQGEQVASGWGLHSLEAADVTRVGFFVATLL